MSATTRARPTPFVLALAMALPILAAAIPVAGFPIDPVQKALIVQNDGGGAPHGTWQVFNETQTLYLHAGNAGATGTGDPIDDQGSTFGPGTSIPGCRQAPNAGSIVGTGAGNPGAIDDPCNIVPAMMDFQRTTATGTGKGGRYIGSGDILQVDANPELNVTDDVTILRFDAQVYASGLSPGAKLEMTVYRRSSSIFPYNPSLPGDECMDAQTPPAQPPRQKKADPFDPFDRFPATIVLNAVGDYKLTNFASLASAPSVPYVGSVDFGLTPPTLTRGESLCAIVRVQPNAAGVTTMPYGGIVITMGDESVPTFLRVTSDSARMNLWTEDRLGVVSNAMPSAKSSVESQRRVTIHAAVAEQWGTQDCDPIDPANSDADECPMDAFDQNKMRLSVRNLTPGSANYGKYLCLDQGRGFQCDDPSTNALYNTYVSCCSSTEEPVAPDVADSNPIMYFMWCEPDESDTSAPCALRPGAFRNGTVKLEYTFRYGDEFPDGTYEAQYYHAEKIWRARHRFTVGGTEWTLQMAPGESPGARANVDSTHRVFVGQTVSEPTEFVVRLSNLGAGAGTFGVTVPTPGDGWKATVTPSTVTLQSKDYQDFVVTVVPPPPGSQDAFAGKSKIVSVTAVSIADNSIKTRYLETVLTGERKSGVDLIPSLNKIELRPAQTITIPATVRNNGTVRDVFVVSSSGLPTSDPTSGAMATGWSALASPAFVDIFAASREEVIITVRAPEEAVPGDSFLLNLTAVHVSNRFIRDTEFITIFVKIVDAFHAVTYCGKSVGVYDDFGRDDEDIKGSGDVIGRPEDLPDSDPLQAADRCTISPRYNPDLPMCWESEPFEDQTPNEIPCETEVDTAFPFRVRVDNTGDREDEYTLTAAWVTPAPPDAHKPPPVAGQIVNPNDDDSPGCDGGRDGVPDGWRFRVLDDPLPGPVPDSQAPLDPSDNLGLVGTFVGLSTTAAQPPHPANAQYGNGQKTGSGTNFLNPAYYGFSGEMNLGTLKLQKGQTQDLYIELGWIRSSGGCRSDSYSFPTECIGGEQIYGICGGSITMVHPADDAELRLSIRSKNDIVQRDIQYLDVHLEEGDEGISSNGMDVEAATGIIGGGNVVQQAVPGLDEQTFSTPEKTPITYIVRGINTGNGEDDMRFDVTAAAAGWTHTLVGTRYVNSDELGIDPGPPQRGCTKVRPTEVLCKNMGTFDEARIEIRVTPPQNARVGDLDTLDVTISSATKCDPLVGNCTLGTDSLRIRTRIQGKYFFELEDLAGERLAFEGQSIAFPFSVHNDGDENDVYQVAIDFGAGGLDSNKTWKPFLSSGPLVAVPAGHSFHGFLGAIVPKEVLPAIGDDESKKSPSFPGKCEDIQEHFRVRVQGTRAAGAKQVEVADFFATVDPCITEPYIITSGEPGTRPPKPIQIRSGGHASFDVTTLDGVNEDGSGGDLQYIRYTINPEENPTTTPRGYSFECLYQPDGPDTMDNPVTPQAGDGNCQAKKPNVDFRAFTPNHESIGDFHLVAPEGELGASRVVGRIKAEGLQDATTDPSEMTVNYHDAIINLSSVYGIELVPELPGGDFKVIPMGDKDSGPGVTFKLLVVNTGLSAQNVRLTSTEAPTGWSVSLPENKDTGVYVEPGQKVPIDVTLHAPVGSIVGNEATLLLIGTVIEDTTKVSQLKLTARVGKFEWRVELPDDKTFPQCPLALVKDTLDPTACGAPGEKVSYVIEVTNGDDEKLAVPDYANIRVDFNPAFEDLLTLEWGSECDGFEDRPGHDFPICVLGGPDPATGSFERLFGRDEARRLETRQVTLRVTIPDGVISGTVMPFNIVIESGNSPTPTFTQTSAKVVVLPHRGVDIDGDGLKEYAIDRDGNSTNGFEEYRENIAPGGGMDLGLSTRLANLVAFMDEDARERVADLKAPFNDPTKVDIAGCSDKGDGLVDFLLDDSADGYPDILWMPSDSRFTNLTLTKDVTYDGVREVFFDATGDLILDGWYDIVAHQDGCLLAFFFNQDDDILDYVVDLNHNNFVDEGEPVLIGALDGINLRSIVEMLDMNGDGCRDLVTDTNADGKVDNFVPATKASGGSCEIVPGTSSIPITLKDVTGDGVEDFTYPADGEGRPDSYYDPTTGDAGFIDTQAAFVRELRSHLWLLAAFAFVLVLFVILLVVTRK